MLLQIYLFAFAAGFTRTGELLAAGLEAGAGVGAWLGASVGDAAGAVPAAAGRRPRLLGLFSMFEAR